MRKIYTVFGLLFIALLFSSLRGKNESDDSCGGDGPRKSSGPPSCYAGEPPNNTNCSASGCHQDFAVNSGTALLNLYLGDSAGIYTPGQTYNVTVSLKRTGMVMGGFELIALQDNDITTTPGTISLNNATRTQLINAANPHPGGCAPQNKTWIEHTSAGIEQVSGDSISWQFNWQAPATPVGPVTFYLAATDCNKDFDNTGDYVYTLTKTINALPVSTGISQTISETEILFYPNPVTDILYFKLPENEVGKIKVFDATGKLVIATISAPSETQTISLTGLPAGVYMLSYQSSTLGFGKRVVKE